MGTSYLLGVDGGNSKTDYLLYTADLKLVDFFRGPTCSHEALPDSYDGAYHAMMKGVHLLLERNGLQIEDIACGVFGLAGVDIPEQKRNLEETVRRMGIRKFLVVNDSMLGIKSATSEGVGICSVNGTGTSTSGIDKKGHILQVGGIGEIVGDQAGGAYIMRCAVRAVYDALYRCGPETELTPVLMKLMDISDKALYLATVHSSANYRIHMTEIVIAVFEAANHGDRAAVDILTHVGNQLAKSAAGCIRNLCFGAEETVEIVLLGSVWVKGNCPIMRSTFEKQTAELAQRQCVYRILRVPPAVGAVLWAYELLNGAVPPVGQKEEICKSAFEPVKTFQ